MWDSVGSGGEQKNKEFIKSVFVEDKSVRKRILSK